RLLSCLVAVTTMSGASSSASATGPGMRRMVRSCTRNGTIRTVCASSQTKPQPVSASSRAKARRGLKVPWTPVENALMTEGSVSPRVTPACSPYWISASLSGAGGIWKWRRGAASALPAHQQMPTAATAISIRRTTARHQLPAVGHRPHLEVQKQRETVHQRRGIAFDLKHAGERAVRYPLVGADALSERP